MSKLVISLKLEKKELLEAFQRLLDDLTEHATGSFGDTGDVARTVIAKAKEE